MSLGPLYVFLGEVSVQVLCPFINWAVCLPGVESCERFIELGDQPLSEVSLANMLSHIVGSLHFLAAFFSHAETFYVDDVPFVYSFLYVPCSRGHISENIAVWNIYDFPAYVLL